MNLVVASEEVNHRSKSLHPNLGLCGFAVRRLFTLYQSPRKTMQFSKFCFHEVPAWAEATFLGKDRVTGKTA